MIVIVTAKTNGSRTALSRNPGTNKLRKNNMPAYPIASLATFCKALVAFAPSLESAFAPRTIQETASANASMPNMKFTDKPINPPGSVNKPAIIDSTPPVVLRLLPLGLLEALTADWVDTVAGCCSCGELACDGC